MSSLRVSPRAFLLLCRVTLATVVLNVVTGAAVRLSDSGLGCPDWPTCSQHHLTPPLRLHPLVEFGNRVVVALLLVAAAVTLLAALARRPARSDLRWLSAGLVLGIVAEALVGAVVVYSKLNAYVVVCHFLVGMALVAVATVLALRADHAVGHGNPAVGRPVLRTTRVFLVLLGAAIVAGTATTGAGPHAGGKGAKRIPVPLVDATRVHAEFVLAAVAALLVVIWLLRRTDAPARNQDAALVLLSVMVVQGIIGYTQYFTRLPALLVGIHVFGASVVWLTALWFHHGLSDHAAEPPGVGGPAVADAGAVDSSSAPLSPSDAAVPSDRAT
ncbi:MAG TPA: COX15/CtaA family protein, partial [Acidimicrobiales bacterium]|nr:COX15/CtaA family protein [Acidimicrobiales bacterium]